ncbi:hypothetical protein [Natrialbaceae archaeon AArc-T1-2]|uniref:hypothetical protein n=1 Tax=Natrialbaceae archaeon AArc-T1-2 TaxID=3053904 RepID=UPI00255AD3DE|nr:hypothetical protein [Natrialbaceae archaeon AArc-T1-2]WIV67059.1 hypothetical protein QQ977_15445 [Natrialbaceae archaeon AArc-T1-2]
MAQNPRDTETETALNERSNSRLTRRSYVRSLAAVATATTGAAALGTASADEYEVVELEPGERHEVQVGDGETLENKLYDQTADGAQVVIVAQGTDWTVRNIGIAGENVAEGAQFGVADTGGNTSTIENVYLGDGAIDQHRAGLGMWVSPQHNGHLDVERVNIQGMGDNSFYCSPPGGSGTVHIDRCYSKNSWVAHYRLAQGKVTNCVAVNDGEDHDGRGIWAWAPGPVEVENCHLLMNDRHNAFVGGASNQGSRIEVTDTEWDTGVVESNGSTIEFVSGNGRDPEDVVPDGCPTSPEEAASGDGQTSSETDESPLRDRLF